MKLLGASAVLCSCLGMSLTALRTARERTRCLSWLCRAAEAIRAELSTRLSPLPGLMRLAAERTKGACRSFFEETANGLADLSERSFYELWADSARKRLPFLPEEVRDELLQLGLSLGRYELQEQLAACDRFLNAVTPLLGEESRSLREKRRVYLALGTAAGAFLCLLFL